MAILAAVLLALAAVLTVLVACGAPLGEFTMGGRYKVLPGQYRIIAVISLFIQLLAIIIVLQADGIMALWFSEKVTRYIAIFFAIYLSLNTIMNLFSTSKKEKYFATPLSLITAVCFWFTIFNK